MSVGVQPRWSPLGTDALLGITAVAALALLRLLPPSPADLVAVLLAVYLFRWRTFGLPRGSWSAFGVLVAACIAVLPFVYGEIADWGNPHVFGIAHWIGMPAAIFTVPLVSGLSDAMHSPAPTWRRFVLRSAVEIVVLFPIWFFVWVHIELGLGWIWI